MLGFFQYLRFMVAQPEDFGSDGLLSDCAACTAQNIGGIGFTAQVFDFFHCTGVILLDRITQYLIVLIEQHDGWHHATRSNRGNLPGFYACVTDALRHPFLHILPPLIGIFFSPTGIWREQCGRFFYRGNHMAFQIDQDDLGSRGTYVDTH